MRQLLYTLNMPLKAVKNIPSVYRRETSSMLFKAIRILPRFIIFTRKRLLPDWLLSSTIRLPSKKSLHQTAKPESFGHGHPDIRLPWLLASEWKTVIDWEEASVAFQKTNDTIQDTSPGSSLQVAFHSYLQWHSKSLLQPHKPSKNQTPADCQLTTICR